LPVDKWGIPMFYPTKKTAGITGTGSAFYWTQNNDITKDDDFDGTAMVRIGKEHDSPDYKVIDSTTGEWQFPFNFDAGDGLSLSGPTGHHTGGETHGCQGFTYMINVDLMSSPPLFRFRKETYHVQYDNHPEGKWTHPAAPDTIVGGGWFGYGWVAYNKKDGRGPGKDSRICEAWWNNDPVADITNWVMLKRVEDRGDGITNWGVPATCDGEAHQVGTWSNIQFRFKVDASDFSLHPLIPEPDSGPNIVSIGGENMSFADCESRGYGKRADMPRDIEMKCLFRFNDTSGKCRFKNISLREIDPTLSFEDSGGGGTTTPPPEEQPPQPSTVIGSFQLQWDINTIRSSPCAGTGTGGGAPGGTGNTTFYTVYTDNGTDSDKEFSDSSTFQHRKRVVMSPANSSSVFSGKIVKQIDIPLKKVGTPDSTVKIVAKIWNSSGSVVYKALTEIDPTTLSTSYTKKTFDFSTNTHPLVTGDRVGVQWNGTSSDNDYVVFSYKGTSTSNTRYFQFEEGDTWDEKSRSVTMDVWQ
jgi:hypothetical protein